MGLLDRINKKKESGSKEAPKGKALNVKTQEELLETCSELTKNFKGLMLLSGNLENENYSASLLIEDGVVVGATFEFKGMSHFNKNAIDGIRSNLKGSAGKLSIFEFEGDEITKVKELNKEALLKDTVSLNTLGLKVKLMIDDLKDDSSSFEHNKRRAKSFSGFIGKTGSLNLLEIARSPVGLNGSDNDKNNLKEPVGIQKAFFGGVPRLGAGGPDNEKLENIQKIKKEREQKLAEKVQANSKKQALHEQNPGGEKIHTTIDRLYNLLKKYKRMRIDDKLACSLGVSKVQIEEWAVILEEHSLVELRYSALGEPEIKIRERS